MNIDSIFEMFLKNEVEFLLLGGVNFMIQHEPVLTFDVDVWIRPEQSNLRRCEQALVAMEAEWGESEGRWGPVSKRQPDWLGRQPVYCMICKYGALDLFLEVKGLSDWYESATRAVDIKTTAGITCRGLSDEDMLRCQEALPEREQKKDRIRALRRALGKNYD